MAKKTQIAIGKRGGKIAGYHVVDGKLKAYYVDDTTGAPVPEKKKKRDNHPYPTHSAVKEVIEDLSRKRGWVLTHSKSESYESILIDPVKDIKQAEKFKASTGDWKKYFEGPIKEQVVSVLKSKFGEHALSRIAVEVQPGGQIDVSTDRYDEPPKSSIPKKIPSTAAEAMDRIRDLLSKPTLSRKDVIEMVAEGLGGDKAKARKAIRKVEATMANRDEHLDLLGGKYDLADGLVAGLKEAAAAGRASKMKPVELGNPEPTTDNLIKLRDEYKEEVKSAKEVARLTGRQKDIAKLRMAEEKFTVLSDELKARGALDTPPMKPAVVERSEDIQAPAPKTNFEKVGKLVNKPDANLLKLFQKLSSEGDAHYMMARGVMDQLKASGKLEQIHSAASQVVDKYMYEVPEGYTPIEGVIFSMMVEAGEPSDAWSNLYEMTIEHYNPDSPSFENHEEEAQEVINEFVSNLTNEVEGYLEEHPIDRSDSEVEEEDEGPYMPDTPAFNYRDPTIKLASSLCDVRDFNGKVMAMSEGVIAIEPAQSERLKNYEDDDTSYNASRDYYDKNYVKPNIKKIEEWVPKGSKITADEFGTFRVELPNTPSTPPRPSPDGIKQLISAVDQARFAGGTSEFNDAKWKLIQALENSGNFHDIALAAAMKKQTFGSLSNWEAAFFRNTWEEVQNAAKRSSR